MKQYLRIKINLHSLSLFELPLAKPFSVHFPSVSRLFFDSSQSIIIWESRKRKSIQFPIRSDYITRTTLNNPLGKNGLSCLYFSFW